MNQPNIVVMVFDTMRLDALVGKFFSESAPSIRHFSNDAVTFKRAIAPSSWTVPSHASMFLGQYPSEHGMHESKGVGFDDVVLKMSLTEKGNLVQQLRTLGYNTVGYSANMSISSYNGFDNGFNLFTNTDSQTIRPNIFYESNFSIENRSIDNFIQYYNRYRDLRKHRFPLRKSGRDVLEGVFRSSFELPFFLFLNVVEMHEPYLLSEMTLFNILKYNQTNDYIGIRKYPRRVLEGMRKKYFVDATLECDYIFSVLLKFLKGINQYEDTMIILTSDHGQAFKEHGYYGHGKFLFDELVRVPLIIKPPNGARVGEDISSQAGYESLVSLKNLIISTAKGQFSMDDMITETAFSEAFSSENYQTANLKSRNQIQKTRELNRGYKAIFKGDYKLTIEMSNHSVVEMSKKGASKQELDKNIIADLSEEMELFTGINGLSDEIVKSGR